MNCERVQNLLSAYVDHELSPDEQRVVRAHLVGCSACSAEHETLVALKGRLSALESLEVPEDFFSELSARLDVEEPISGASTVGGVTFRWRHYWPAAAAAVLAVAVLVPSLRLSADHQVIDPDSFFRQHTLTSAAQPLADNSVLSYYVANTQSGTQLNDSQTADRIKLIGQPLTP
jgi:anti-sigma factor RsiW